MAAPGITGSVIPDEGRLFYKKHGFLADGMTMYNKRLSSNELSYCREL